MGLWCLARGFGWLWLSLGSRGTDPNFDGAERFGRYPRRRYRQQCSSFLWSTGRTDHRVGGGNWLSVAGRVWLGWISCCCAGTSAPVGVDLPRVGQDRIQG